MGVENEHLIDNPLERIKKLEIAVETLQREAVTDVAQVGGVTDHGALNGLDDDDHSQYILVSGSRGFTGVVSGVTPTAVSHLATKGYVDASPWTDHGNLSGLGDDDHAQYVHVSSARTITAQHSFAPTSAQAPFTLGANAQGQLVTGLNADQLDGYEATAFSLAGHTHAHSELTGVTSNQHHDPVTEGNGISVSGQQVSVALHGTWSGLEFDGGDLRLDISADYTWAGWHTFEHYVVCTVTFPAYYLSNSNNGLRRDGVGALRIKVGGKDVTAFSYNGVTVLDWAGGLQYVQSDD